MRWQRVFSVFHTTNQCKLICLQPCSRNAADEHSATSTKLLGGQFFLVSLEARKHFSKAIKYSAAFCLLRLFLTSALVTHATVGTETADPGHLVQQEPITTRRFFQSQNGLWLLAQHGGLVSKLPRASKGQHARSVVTEYESGTGYLQQTPSYQFKGTW